MRKTLRHAGLTAAAVLLLSSSVYAQNVDTESVLVTVNVNARARLTLSSLALTIDDEDPDTVPTLTSGVLSINVGARTSSAGNVTLTVQATQNLTSGSDVIPIANLTWTATGTNFVAGTSNTATAQSVGSWTGSGTRLGSQTYRLPNSWSYAPGSYTTTLNYTLTAP